MLPIADYFPRLYREDLKLFHTTGRDHGPVGRICYANNVGNLYDPKQVPRFADRAGFLCVTYFLNIARQGREWTDDASRSASLERLWAHCEPYLDVLACHSFCCFNGPENILNLANAQDTQLHDRKGYLEHPIALHHDEVRACGEHFVNVYLPQMDARAGCEVLSRRSFVKRMLSEEVVRLCLGT